MQHNPQFLALVESARGQIEECTIHDIQKRLEAQEAFVLFDVREDHEWLKGHLPSARHLGRGILERDIEATVPDTGTEIILYCGGGYRSALAALNLKQMGYTRVISMDGGFRAWKEAGFPICHDHPK